MMEIRYGESQDIGRIFKLFERNEFTEENISPEDFTLYYESLFFKNPDRIPYPLVGFEKGELVAHHGLVPIRYQVDGKKCIAGLGSNLVVDKEKRSMARYLQFQSRFFAEYAQKKIDFAYGLVTRKEVLKLHLRTGFRRVGEIPVYARPIQSRRLLQTKGLGIVSPLVDRVLNTAFLWPRGKECQVKKVDAFSPEWDRELKELSSAFVIGAVKTSENLNWRFKELPYRNYQIWVASDEAGKLLGYLVLREMPLKEFRGLAVVDLLFSSEHPEYGHALLRRAYEEARNRKVDLLATVLNPESPYQPVLQRWGFFKTPESFNLVVNTPKNSPHVTLQNRFRDWHITWFDHDFV